MLDIILKIVLKVSVRNYLNVIFIFYKCIFVFLDNELIPLEDIGEDESPFLTLEEAEKLASEKKEKAHSKKWAQASKNQVLFES